MESVPKFLICERAEHDIIELHAYTVFPFYHELLLVINIGI